MKLSKEYLMLALHLAVQHFTKNLKSYYNRQSFTDAELRETFDECAAALKNGTLEIEGYERNEWVKLNPDDKSTFPTTGQRVLIWCEGEICTAYAYVDDVPGQDPCCIFAMPEWSGHSGEVTHWRPSPQPPKAEEK